MSAFQSQTDAILGWVEKKNGRPFLMDTWISGYTQPLLDASQDIYNMSGKLADGVTTLSFTRKRITNDDKDLSFTNDQCLYIMFMVKGGAFNSVNKKIRKHEVIPSISADKVCIKSCGGEGTLYLMKKNRLLLLQFCVDDVYEVPTTTPEPPGLAYNLEFKIVDLGENFVAPKPGTQGYDDLTNSISDNFEPLFKKIPGYKRIVVDDLKE